jgi:hypothetical protein
VGLRRLARAPVKKVGQAPACRLLNHHPSKIAAIRTAGRSLPYLLNRQWLRYFRSMNNPYVLPFPSRVVHGPGLDDYTLYWPTVLR